MVILPLIFVPKLRNKDVDNEPNPPIEDTGNNNEEYATYFSVNLPNTINLYLNSSVKLKSNYINISPVNMLNKVDIEITKSNAITNKIIFVNNAITATEIGDYKIKFSVASSATTEFSKTISVKVHNDINQAHILQKSNFIHVGDEIDFDNLFQLNSDLSFTANADNKVDLVNNKFIAKLIGESVVNFTFTESNVEYNYEFIFNIKDIPYYTITLENVLNNTIQIQKGKALLINYNVSNRAEEKIPQDISVISLDTSIVIIERVEEPIIKIKALEIGETNIVITYVVEPTIKLEVKVIVI